MQKLDECEMANKYVKRISPQGNANQNHNQTLPRMAVIKKTITSASWA
jgi:hypothetical protein